MLWTIARKEIVSNLLSYKFFIVILLTALLIFTSFFIMYRDYKARLADYQLIKPAAEQPIAVIPPNPLSIFAKGLEEAMTRSFEISRIGIDVRAGQQSGNVIFSFFPSPDFLYVVRVVLSLVALLFGFDQVSKEKEGGTLRLMLSNSISRAKILLGKWLGNYLSLAVPFLLVTAIGFALLNLDSNIRFSSNAMGRIALIIAFALIYVALFLSLGIFISTLTRRSAASIVILLFLWALLVFVIPNLGTLLARQLVDVPSVTALSEKRDQVWTREVLLGEIERQKAQSDSTRTVDWRARFREINRENDELEADYRNKFNRLVGLSKNISRISPAAGFVYAVTEIAGTGVSEERRLKEEIIRHKDLILNDFDRNIKQHPAFVYGYRTVGQILVEGGLFDAAWLLVFNIFFFALSYFTFVRYDVR
jgi:ABC-type transport system involved in multi-copper enzyme maturation permease subunit